MTDLSAVKTGDRLKVDCLVTESDLTSRIWCLRVGDDDTVLIEKAALEEAAEHIPAPRIFKRGDWVKYTEEIDCGASDPKGCCGYCESTRIKRHGLVCNQVANRVAVFWLDTGMETLDSDELESDEAPE